MPPAFVEMLARKRRASAHEAADAADAAVGIFADVEF